MEVPETFSGRGGGARNGVDGSKSWKHNDDGDTSMRHGILERVCKTKPAGGEVNSQTDLLEVHYNMGNIPWTTQCAQSTLSSDITHKVNKLLGFYFCIVQWWSMQCSVQCFTFCFS